MHRWRSRHSCAPIQRPNHGSAVIYLVVPELDPCMQPWKIQLRSYASGAWHYRWAGVALAWGLCVLGLTALLFVPNQFQAVAKIYVDADTMMAPLLKGIAGNTDPQQQASVMLNT